MFAEHTTICVFSQMTWLFMGDITMHSLHKFEGALLREGLLVATRVGVCRLVADVPHVVR